MKSTLSPRLETVLATLERTPWPSAIMVTTAAMPMVMPMTVSPARSLLRWTIRSAIRIEERTRESISFVPERGDGIEERGAARGEEAEDDADDHARAHRRDDRWDRELHREIEALRGRHDRAAAEED